MELPGSFNDVKALHPEASNEEIMMLHSAELTAYRDYLKRIKDEEVIAKIAMRYGQKT